MTINLNLTIQAAINKHSRSRRPSIYPTVLEVLQEEDVGDAREVDGAVGGVGDFERGVELGGGDGEGLGGNVGEPGDGGLVLDGFGFELEFLFGHFNTKVFVSPGELEPLPRLQLLLQILHLI